MSKDTEQSSASASIETNQYVDAFAQAIGDIKLDYTPLAHEKSDLDKEKSAKSASEDKKTEYSGRFSLGALRKPFQMSMSISVKPPEEDIKITGAPVFDQQDLPDSLIADGGVDVRSAKRVAMVASTSTTDTGDSGVNANVNKALFNFDFKPVFSSSTPSSSSPSGSAGRPVPSPSPPPRPGAGRRRRSRSKGRNKAKKSPSSQPNLKLEPFGSDDEGKLVDEDEDAKEKDREAETDDISKKTKDKEPEQEQGLEIFGSCYFCLVREKIWKIPFEIREELDLIAGQKNKEPLIDFMQKHPDYQWAVQGMLMFGLKTLIEGLCCGVECTTSVSRQRLISASWVVECVRTWIVDCGVTLWEIDDVDVHEMCIEVLCMASVTGPEGLGLFNVLLGVGCPVVSAVEGVGSPPLIGAILLGDHVRVRSLLAAGADPNTIVRGMDGDAFDGPTLRQVTALTFDGAWDGNHMMFWGDSGMKWRTREKQHASHQGRGFWPWLLKSSGESEADDFAVFLDGSTQCSYFNPCHEVVSVTNPEADISGQAMKTMDHDQFIDMIEECAQRGLSPYHLYSDVQIDKVWRNMKGNAVEIHVDRDGNVLEVRKCKGPSVKKLRWSTLSDGASHSDLIAREFVPLAPLDKSLIDEYLEYCDGVETAALYKRCENDGDTGTRMSLRSQIHKKKSSAPLPYNDPKQTLLSRCVTEVRRSFYQFTNEELVNSLSTDIIELYFPGMVVLVDKVSGGQGVLYSGNDVNDEMDDTAKTIKELSKSSSVQHTS